MAKTLKSDYCTIYLARHGETQWNRQKRVQGHQDSPLTSTGKQQARQLAKSLRHLKFDHRSLTFLREISVAYSGKTILAVTHGGVIRMILIHLGFGTHDELAAGTVANTAWVKLRSDGTDFFVDDTFGITKLPVTS